MSGLRKAGTDHAYFLTFTVAGWIDPFFDMFRTVSIRKNKGGFSNPVGETIYPSFLAIAYLLKQHKQPAKRVRQLVDRGSVKGSV